jgi:cellulose synthase/poly-beta-1,6-N-acetylglucosamine synthase-like glycosyltransferase
MDALCAVAATLAASAVREWWQRRRWARGGAY